MCNARDEQQPLLLSVFNLSSQLITSVFPWLFIGCIVQLLNLLQNKGQTQCLRGQQRFNRSEILHHHYRRLGWSLGSLSSYHCNVPYQLQFWAFTTSIICNAKSALSAPACSQPVGSPFCLTLSVWDEIPQVHAPAPQGNSHRYGYNANYSDRVRGGQ